MKAPIMAVRSGDFPGLQRAACRGTRWSAHREAIQTGIHGITRECQRMVIARNETGLR